MRTSRHFGRGGKFERGVPFSLIVRTMLELGFRLRNKIEGKGYHFAIFKCDGFVYPIGLYIGTIQGIHYIEVPTLEIFIQGGEEDPRIDITTNGFIETLLLVDDEYIDKLELMLVLKELNCHYDDQHKYNNWPFCVFKSDKCPEQLFVIDHVNTPKNKEGRLVPRNTVETFCITQGTLKGFFNKKKFKKTMAEVDSRPPGLVNKIVRLKDSLKHKAMDCFS
jgi:hypothetical protein